MLPDTANIGRGKYHLSENFGLEEVPRMQHREDKSKQKNEATLRFKNIYREQMLKSSE